ncbi:ABC transporter permease [Halobacillus ihumii]|uniref:ABC transporter permease n=1 Tax=Halobacillus ihumii TaxID=2686092 RepID=UPI0013D5ADB6|nr:ABC transporter permease [Halobacillus ihumii]
MILRKSIPRNLKQRKWQYSGAILLLFLSVMLYVSLSMAISTLENRNKQFSSEHNQESFHFVPGESLSHDLIDEWGEEFDVVLETRQHHDFKVAESTLRLFEATDQINIPYYSKGERPDQPGEIAIAEGYASTHGFEIGDRIKIGSKEATVTGYVFLPDYIYMIEQQTDILSNREQFGVGVTAENTLQHFSEALQTEVLGLTKDGKVPEHFRSAITNDVSLLQFVPSSDNARIQFVESEIEAAHATVTALPLFILGLSIIMILILMKRLIDMQRKEIGTLMALGYSRRELSLHYIGYAMFVSFTGSTLGLLAGGVLSIPITNLYGTYFNLPAITLFDWSPMVLVIGFVIPVLLLLLVTFAVVNRSLQVSPLSLLHSKGVASGKKSRFEKLPFLKRLRFVNKFRLRLLFRRKARVFYMFLGVMFSTILLLFGFTMAQAMDDLVDTTYKKILTYDYAVYYQSIRTDGVSGSKSPFLVSELSVKGEEVNLTGFGMEEQTTHVQLFNDEEKLNSCLSEGVIISEPAASVLNVSTGDSITLVNSLNDQELQVSIAGITNIYIGTNVYLSRAAMAEFLGYPEESYSAVWQNEKPVNTHNIYKIENKQKVIDSFEAMSKPTRYSIFIMAFFAVLIGVIVLTLLTNLIVEENTPSISLFKVLGYHDDEIAKLVLNVYTPLVVIFYFVAIPIGIMAIRGMMGSLVEQTGFLMPVNLNWVMTSLGFVIMMGTYWLSLYFSKRKLKNVSLQEALKKQQD